MGQFAAKPQPPRSFEAPPQPWIPTTAYLVPSDRRRSGSSFATHSRSRFSSRCPTPSAAKRPEDYDECRDFRRMLGAVHKICKSKPGQIDALCQSLGLSAGRDGLDERLVMCIRAFDHSVMELYPHLHLNLHFLHAFPLALSLKEFTDTLGELAVDLEVLEKQLARMTFASTETTGQQKALSKLKTEAKELGERFFSAAGKLDALSSMGKQANGQALAALTDRRGGDRTPSIVTLRTTTRSPSPAAAHGSSPTTSQILQSSAEPTEKVGRGVGMVGIV